MTDRNLSGDKVRQVTFVILRAALGVALLIVLFHYISVIDLVNSWRNARVEYLSGAVLLAGANLGVQILKWRYFVRLVNPASTTMQVVASFMFGMSMGTVTPGQIGEFGGRALGHNSLRAGTVVGLTLVDRLQMICVLGLAGVVSLPFLFHLGTPAAVLIIVPTAATLGLLFFNPQIVPILIRRLNLKILKRPSVQDFTDSVVVFRFEQLLRSLIYSVVFYLIVYVQMYLLLNAFSQVGPVDAFLGFASMMLLKALVPISLGDLGVREVSSVYFFSLRGVAHATSLSASLLLFAINVLAPSIVGLIFMPKFPSK